MGILSDSSVEIKTHSTVRISNLNLQLVQGSVSFVTATICTCNCVSTKE